MIPSALRHCAVREKERLSALPKEGPLVLMFAILALLGDGTIVDVGVVRVKT